MTKLTKHRPREALDADAFVEAIQAVLDYLWEDEQRHHSEQDSADQPHIFHSLQVIREWLSDLRAEARQVEATEPSTPAAQTASTVKNEDGVGASRKITLHEGDCGTYTMTTPLRTRATLRSEYHAPAEPQGHFAFPGTGIASNTDAAAGRGATFKAVFLGDPTQRLPPFPRARCGSPSHRLRTSAPAAFFPTQPRPCQAAPVTWPCFLSPHRSRRRGWILSFSSRRASNSEMRGPPERKTLPVGTP